MLDVPKEVKSDTLKFSHLLDAEALLLKKANDIRELQARAIVITKNTNIIQILPSPFL